MVLSDQEWVSVAVSAKRSGRTNRHLRRLCERGILVHRKEGNAYFIDPVSLEQYMSENSKEQPTSRTSSPDIGRTSEKGADINQTSPAVKGPASPVDKHTTSGPNTSDITAAKIPTCPDMSDRCPQKADTDQADTDALSLSAPADIAILSQELRTARQAVLRSSEDLSEIAELLFECLCSEYRKNQKVQNALIHLLNELQTPADLMLRRGK